MKHADYLIDLIDKTGQVTGQQPRRLVDKTRDLYHSVHVQLVTPDGRLVLAGIPKRNDLPNLYAQKLGSTVATIRRSGETARQAAVRALERELFIKNGRVGLLGERLLQLPERPYFITAFYLVAAPPDKYSTVDIGQLVVLTPKQLEDMLAASPSQIAPTFGAIWRDFLATRPDPLITT